MILLRNIAYVLVMIMFLSSCEKEEIPVKLPPRDFNVRMMGVDLGTEYDKQVYINLNSGIVQSVDNNSWDLSFDAAPEGFTIYINGGKNVLVANTGSTDFSADTKSSELNWRWDEASGNADSLALSHWCNRYNYKTFDSVYVIDRGKGSSSSDNYFKFKIIAVTPQKYVISVADMSGKFIKETNIYKSPEKMLVYFSFDNGGTYYNFEPPIDSWHFKFLRYRWIYYEFNPPLLYQVTGVHLNSTMLDVAIDSSLTFYDIKFNQSLNPALYYSNDRDQIGFEWKYPDFTPNGVRYRTRTYINYFLRYRYLPDLVYKLRFIDFYDDKGNKGCPRFEYQLLN
ncbi:MAG: HmuY family protein [Bacteroidota bacterium]|jgi:hypothetical protein|nr:hypothetical protein [Sphingobacteriales bacterium]